MQHCAKCKSLSLESCESDCLHCLVHCLRLHDMQTTSAKPNSSVCLSRLRPRSNVSNGTLMMLQTLSCTWGHSCNPYKSSSGTHCLADSKTKSCVCLQSHCWKVIHYFLESITALVTKKDVVTLKCPYSEAPLKVRMQCLVICLVLTLRTSL